MVRFMLAEEELMDKKAFNKIIEKLNMKKDEILETIDRELQNEIDDIKRENITGDIVDTANTAYDLLVNSKLSEKEQEKLGEIMDALKRIEENVYGKCVVCGNNIEEKRLLAIPEAKKCIVCKSAEEKRKF